MELQIVKCMFLIQQLARHLTGADPLRVEVTAWEEVNLLPRSYVVSIGDLISSGSHPSSPSEALLAALIGLLVQVYTRLHKARTEPVIPQLQEQARQFSAVAALGY